MKPHLVTSLLAVACLIVGLALGAFAGSWYEARSTTQRIAAMEDDAESRARAHQQELRSLGAQVDLLQIHLRLGRIAMEADHQDYGSAGERAAHFFDDLALVIEAPNLGERQKAALHDVLDARDELIAGLATAQPSAAERLKELYLQIFDSASPRAPDGHLDDRGES